MEDYDKENCSGNILKSDAVKGGALSASSSKNAKTFDNRRKWLESGAAGRPNPTAFAATGDKKTAGLKTGVISERRKWIASEMEKGPMTAAPKGQNIAGSGIIARQRKWVESQMQKGPMTAAPKGQDIAGTGIIEKQRKWAEDQMQKGPMTASSKGQDIAGAGVIARQRKWAEEQARGKVTAQLAAKKDQDVGRKGVIQRQNRFGTELASAVSAKRATNMIEPAQKRARQSAAPTQAAAPKLELATKGKKLPDPTVGCYLSYETNSGGRLVLCYKNGGKAPSNAIGFWAAGEGKSIQGFKFKQDCGRSELIKGIAGGDSNRRRYFDGWCQFVKLAKAMNGSVKKFQVPGPGVEVDVYGYIASESRPVSLNLDADMVDVSSLDAVAVVPRHKHFLQGVKTMPASTFLEKGGIAGSSTTLK
jgi:hypothetical protein